MAGRGGSGAGVDALLQQQAQLQTLNRQLWDLVTELQASHADLVATNAGLQDTHGRLQINHELLQGVNVQLRLAGEELDQNLVDVDEQLKMVGLEAELSSSAPTVAAPRPPTPVAVVRPWQTPPYLQKSRELWRAAKIGNVAYVRQLLMKQVDLSYKDGEYESTALHEAAGAGHLEIVRALISAGASLQVTTMDGATALHYSVRKEPEACTAALISSGMFLDWRDHGGRTALHDAVQFGHVGQVRLLVRAGANGWLRDKEGKTPYQLTANRGIQALLPPP